MKITVKLESLTFGHVVTIQASYPTLLLKFFRNNYIATVTYRWGGKGGVHPWTEHIVGERESVHAKLEARTML